MKELYVFCEGPTEQGFCQQVLNPHLFPKSDGWIHTIKIAHSKSHGEFYRGGIGKYASLQRDIRNTLKSRSETQIAFTSMIDLYGLPKDFPGKSDHEYDPDNPTPYVVALEDAFRSDIGDHRFIPYLQLHEYETMLFADLEGFRFSFENCDAEIQSLQKMIDSFPTLEHINQGQSTAPSKRIIDLIPAYRGKKTSAGPDIAEYIGIDQIRAQSPHFDQWITCLENILWQET